MIYLVMHLFRFTCLRFFQLLVSVGLCLSPKLGKFSAIISSNFKITVSSFSLGFWWYECWIFCFYAIGPWHLFFVFFVSPIYSLLFRFGDFYYFVLRFLTSALSCVLSTIEPIQWFFNFFFYIFSILDIPLEIFYNLSFFVTIVFFISREFLRPC